MRVAFYTLGCKVNQYETEVLREALENAGHTVVSHNNDFDIIIVNSCTVTAESDRKTRQAVRRFKKENPNAIVVLTGCMAQVFSEEARALPADIVVGNTDVSKIPSLVDKFLETKEKIFENCRHERDEKFNTPSISSFAERTRAYMKIEDGCERYCTYCIIPYARGFVRSKPLEEIRAEAEKLSRSGYSEIVLVGINLTAYGKGEAFDLADAVKEVAAADGIKRIRLGSLEPDHMSDEMLRRLKEEPKFCPQFHLSLQSGCDETLKRMNRHYDTAFYKDLVNRIRENFKDASITTDIMVGFAGETEEEFQKSLAFAKETGFAKVHIFAYSKREGTVAARLQNQVSNSVKADRSRKMSEVTSSTEKEFLLSLIGKTYPVLLETFEDGYFYGYTPNYSRVRIKSQNGVSGEIRNVKIIGVNADICNGEFEVE